MASLLRIEGVGKTYVQYLETAGIKSTAELLEKGGTSQGRKELAARSGVSESLILRWVNRADLYRLTGIGKQFAKLLEITGVTSVPELAQCRAENLYRQLAETNLEKKLVRKLPTQAQVGAWVKQAKQLQRIVTL